MTRILILEDNAADANLMSLVLDEYGIEHEWRRVWDEPGFLAGLDWMPDVVLADHSLPSFGALPAVERISERDRRPPVIVVSGTIDEEMAVEAIRAGAEDYVHKDRIRRLGPAVERALARSRERVRERRGADDLREQDVRFRALIEHATDMITLIDRAGAIVYVSPSMERITGLGADAFVGRRALDFVATENRAEAAEIFDRIGALPGCSERFEYRTRRADGTPIWLDAIVTNMLEVAAVRAIVVNQREITEHKRHEAELAERARAAELVAEVGGALTGAGSLREVLHGCAAAIVRNLGAAFARIWTLEETGETLVLQASAGLDEHVGVEQARLDRERPRIGRIVAEREPVSTNAVPDDPDFDDREWATAEGIVSFAGHPLEVEGRLVGVVGMFGRQPFTEPMLAVLGAVAREIALGIERERFEEELARRRHDLETILRTSLSAVSINRASDGAYLEVNDEFLRALGYTRDEVIGRTPWDLGVWADPAVFREVRARLAAQGTVQNLEAELRTKAGEPIWALFSATRIVVRGVPAVVSFTQDIGGLKRTQQALREALERAEQSDRLKTAFLENMSHEFRTPLNVILGYNSLIAERLAEAGDRDAEDLVDAVSRASKRLIRSLHSVLELARFQTRSFTLHRAPVDVARIAQAAVDESRSLAERKGIAISVAVETDRTSALHDDACLASAVGHLVDNAIKFTDRGEVALRLRRDPSDRLVLEVRDTGIGIDPGYLPRLFEPFSQESTGRTRAFEGLGIGLALVRHYLDCNGATIEVESEKGRGTTFTIRFAEEPAP